MVHVYMYGRVCFQQYNAGDVAGVMGGCHMMPRSHSLASDATNKSLSETKGVTSCWSHVVRIVLFAG